MTTAIHLATYTKVVLQLSMTLSIQCKSLNQTLFSFADFMKLVEKCLGYNLVVNGNGSDNLSVFDPSICRIKNGILVGKSYKRIIGVRGREGPVVRSDNV